MIVEAGEKIHVIHRQFFEKDARRHFVGTVLACDGAFLRADGYLFAMDPKSNQFIRRDSLRTRIIPLNSAGFIITVLPAQVQIEKLTYTYHPAGDIVVSDGTGWHLDLNHF